MMRLLRGFAVTRRLGCLAQCEAEVETKNKMLRWAIIFFVIALVAAVLGFGGIAGMSMQIAWILIVVFIVLAVFMLIAGRRAV